MMAHEKGGAFFVTILEMEIYLLCFYLIKKMLSI